MKIECYGEGVELAPKTYAKLEEAINSKSNKTQLTEAYKQQLAAVRQEIKAAENLIPFADADEQEELFSKLDLLYLRESGLRRRAAQSTNGISDKTVQLVLEALDELATEWPVLNEQIQAYTQELADAYAKFASEYNAIHTKCGSAIRARKKTLEIASSTIYNTLVGFGMDYAEAQRPFNEKGVPVASQHPGDNLMK